jgi:hypothetical protein
MAVHGRDPEQLELREEHNGNRQSAEVRVAYRASHGRIYKRMHPDDKQLHFPL